MSTDDLNGNFDISTNGSVIAFGNMKGDNWDIYLGMGHNLYISISNLNFAKATSQTWESGMYGQRLLHPIEMKMFLFHLMEIFLSSKRINMGLRNITILMYVT